MLKDNIKKRRKELNKTLLDVAESLGITEATMQRYESGAIKNIPYEKIEQIAEVLNCTPQYLMGWAKTPNNNGTNSIKIPVLGQVVAGIPLEAVQEIIDYEEIPQALARQGEFFALQIKGRSMEPKFSEGDVVIVRKQEDVDNNDIAIVLVNGDEATIKKVKKFDGGINLIPSNPNYEVKTYTNKEVSELPVRIIGKVVELRAKF